MALAAASLAAFDFALFPTGSSPWVDLGDIFDFGFSLALVGGIAAELRRFWRRLVAAAVFEERRRIARDLHDGVAQELAFIVLEAEGVAGSGPEVLSRIAAAAERARMEVRLAIAAFIEPLETSVAVNVERTATDVARSRCAVDVRACGTEFFATSSEREALHWITREAVSNAIRHGGARTVRLRLRSRRSRAFRVVDDGLGFDGSCAPTDSVSQSCANGHTVSARPSRCVVLRSRYRCPGGASASYGNRSGAEARARFGEERAVGLSRFPAQAPISPAGPGRLPRC